MNRLMTTVAALALLMATTAHAAQGRSGYWTVFDTKGDGENQPLCGMKTEYADVRASIMIKYILGGEHLTVHVFKDGWRFPAEPVDLSISLGFNRDTFGQTIARGGNLSKVGPMIEFKIANKATDNFLNRFAGAEWMWIRFDEGTEKPWPAKMYGSRDAATMFRKCIINLIEARSTQPYGKPKATQPYGNAPTQPYGTPPVKRPGGVKSDDGSV